MKKHTIIISSLLFLSIFLFASTIYFYLKFLQMESRNSYHLSELQDIKNTTLLNQTIPEGTPLDSISLFLEKVNFYSSSSIDSTHIPIDVYPHTPPVKSGRPYCGYKLIFDSDKRFKYAVSNYPCH